MNPSPADADAALTRLIAAARARLQACLPDAAERWLLVDVANQRLVLLRGDRPHLVWPVSTAAAGLDARDGSGGTPPGVHRLGRKIGHDAPDGTVFVSRRATGETWPHDVAAERAGDDLILTRVLTLEGCEEGLNRGPGVDSAARYIYLHGTNHQERIGTPCSHGCVRLTSPHVRELFALVEEGDPVVIA